MPEVQETGVFSLNYDHSHHVNLLSLYHYYGYVSLAFKLLQPLL